MGNLYLFIFIYVFSYYVLIQIELLNERNNIITNMDLLSQIGSIFGIGEKTDSCEKNNVAC